MFPFAIFNTRLLPRIFLSNAEVQLAVVPVTDAGDEPVCHSGALRTVEQTAKAVVCTIDTDGLASGVPAKFTIQAKTCRTVQPRRSSPCLSQRESKGSSMYNILHLQFAATLYIVAERPRESNGRVEKNI